MVSIPALLGLTKKLKNERFDFLAASLEYKVAAIRGSCYVWPYLVYLLRYLHKKGVYTHID